MRHDLNRLTALARTCAVALGALLLGSGTVLAAPQEALGHELRFEGWADDVRPLVKSRGALAPFARHVEHDVLGVRLEYTTQYRGEQITVSGLVVFPMDLEGPAPILVWNHGTIFDEHSAPSSWTDPVRLQLMPALSGVITFMPDYVGYGASASRIHPYVLREDIVPSVIDMIHAGREFLEREGIGFTDELHIWGFSEGGYVALATGYELDTNREHGLAVTEVHAVSGPYDMVEAAHLILADEDYPIPAYAALLLAAYNERYWERPPSEFFVEPQAGLVARFQERKASLGMLAGGMPDTLGQLLAPSFQTDFEGDGEEAVKEGFRVNSIPAWAPSMPVSLYQGTHDIDVPMGIGKKQHAAMLAAGADAEHLSFTLFEGADHQATVLRAMGDYFGHER